jgi:hypothetical protein
VGLWTGWRQWLVGKGQSNHSIRLEEREVCILALKTTTPSKGFLCLKASTKLAYIVSYCIYFSPLQVKNKPCETVTKHAFILGPVSMLENNECNISVIVAGFLCRMEVPRPMNILKKPQLNNTSYAFITCPSILLIYYY